MGKRESIQEKIRRIRPPRVHITYNVETGGAIQVKELPFVVGVLADLSDKNKATQDLKFVQIDRDNFNQVMAKYKPRLSFNVKNTIAENAAQPDASRLSQNLAARMKSDSQLGIELEFDRIEDFEPDQLVQRIKPLRELVEARRSLAELLTKKDSNENLEALLEKILSEPATRKELGAALGVKEEAAAAADVKEEPNA